MAGARPSLNILSSEGRAVISHYWSSAHTATGNTPPRNSQDQYEGTNPYIISSNVHNLSILNFLTEIVKGDIKLREELTNINRTEP